MRISIARDSLIHLLARASKVTNGSTMVPLQNLHFAANGEGVTAHATDLTTHLLARAEAMVTEPGSAMVPVVALRLVKAMSGDAVEISTTEGKVEFRSGRSKASYIVPDFDDMPVAPTWAPGAPCYVDGEAFRGTLSRVRKAMGENRGCDRIWISSVHEESTVWATNGKWAALEPIVLSLAFGMGLGTLSIPGVSLKALDAVIQGLDVVRLWTVNEMLFVGQPEHGLVIRMGDVRPNEIETVMPTGAPNGELRFDRTEALAALRRISLMASKADMGVEFRASEGELSLGYKGSEGELVETMDASGGIEPVLLNHRYLSDVLSALPGDVTLLVQHQAAEPVWFQTSARSAGYRALVMPMRFDG